MKITGKRASAGCPSATEHDRRSKASRFAILPSLPKSNPVSVRNGGVEKIPVSSTITNPLTSLVGEGRAGNLLGFSTVK